MSVFVFNITWAYEHIYEAIRMYVHVLGKFALMFCKWEGGGGSVLSSPLLEYTNKRGVIQGSDLWIYSEPTTLSSLHRCVLHSLCCEGRLFFLKKRVNWPGYGLLQLNLKH